MGWMSPRALNDDPKRWLDVPHGLHESLLGFQEKMFPGFKKKLVEQKIHCLQCEGRETFEVTIAETLKEATCNGYIGDPGNVESLHTVVRGGEQ